MNTTQQQQQNLSGAHPAIVDDITHTSHNNINQQSSHHHLSGAHPATVDDVNQSSRHHLSGAHPATVDDVNQSSHHHLSGAHPATVDDVNQSRNTVEGAPHNNTSLWMKKPENTTASAISSTPSEYGSDDSSRRSSQASRPVADKNAFIQTDETNKHWQNNISPAERAKQLATEMDHTLEERRKSASSSDSNDKTLKIAKKEININ